MKHFYKKLCSGLLAVIMMLTMCGTALAAAVPFPDISGHWAEEIINELSADGIIAGYGDGQCHPNNAITRGEFATLVARCFDLAAEQGDTSGFTDVTAHWAAKYICGLADKGIIVLADYGDTYEPDEKITRIEMIRMMVRAIGKNSEAEKKNDFTGFVDDTDIKATDRGYVGIAKQYKIVVGFPDGTVRPYRTATRAEGFAMLKRMISAYDEIKRAEEEKPGKPDVYPAPTIAFTLPETVYAGSEVTVAATVKNASAVDWSLTKDGKSASVEGFTEKGGSLLLDETGTYTLTATATNPKGKTAECSQTITVYPVVGLAFTLPATAHTDTAIPIDLLTENIGEASAVWSITQDGQEVSLLDAANGFLDNTGGILQFVNAGEYMVTASVTDALGKVYSCSQSVKVYPTASIELSLPKTTHTDSEEYITVSGENLKGLPIVWAVTKDGEDVDPAEILEGNLTGSNSTIRFTTPGTYTLTVTATDETGRSYSATDRITVYPVGTVGFFIPSVFHTDDEVQVEAAITELADNALVWTLTRNGESVSLKDYLTGALNENGGTIQVREKGNYELTASFTDGGGREYSYHQTFTVYPVPAVDFSLPRTAWTDSNIAVTVNSADTEDVTIEWLVDNTYGYQDWNTYIDGTLDNDGGTIRFKRAGSYELVARITDATGRVFLYELNAVCEVQPMLNLRFTIPELFAAGETVDVRTAGNNNVLPVDWTLEKDGQQVQLSDCTTGSLNAYGGRLAFSEHGDYTLTASVIDVLGRNFSYSASFYVYPVVEFSVSTPASAHIGTDISVAVSGSYLDGCTIEWSLEKEGQSVAADGLLNIEGGTLVLRETGSYTLTAELTDAYGNVKTRQSSFEITNNAPNAPYIATNVNYTDGINTYSANCKVKATVSVTSADADSDAFSFEYDTDSASTGYYGLGTHKVRVRAIDEWGAASEWSEQTFTVTCVQPSLELSCATLGDEIVTEAENLEFDAAVITTTPYKITAKDYYYPEDTSTTMDIPALAHTTINGLEYQEGRHFLIVQAMDWFGNTAYASRFFVMGEDEAEKSSEMNSMSTTVYENGVYDGDTPMAYIESFNLSIPAISGHNTSCSDVITISGVTEDGITEKLLTFKTNNGYVYVSSDGTYKYTNSNNTITTGTWNTWNGKRYTQLIFNYTMTSGHESCLAAATEGMSYSVRYDFIPLDESDWEKLFQ